ncbi:MAG: hypothetical protein KDE67_00245 [Sphingobium sp.]|jgi:hypothetical protein|nr:hypothetical protein [Sphingobium sp.]MCP5397683.1 hypothetical protein [Sphingomonas sp.]
MNIRIFLSLFMLLLPACVAKTALDVATAPVKAGAKAADWATTSQEEADRNRGREMRKAEERERKACKKEGREDC